MSATLTPERKSARDRPGVGHKVGDWGRERGGHRRLDRGARGQQARALSISTHTPRGSAVFSSHADPRRACCILPLLLRLSMSPPSPTCARPASLLLPPAAPRRRRHASYCCSLSCAKHLRCCTYGCRHLCPRTRTRMHEIWCVGPGCGAHSESTSSIASPPPRQPLLSGHKND